MKLNPLEHPVCLDFPLLLETTAWAGHIPFAMFAVSAAQPKIIVELGAYRGVSYCAFCQAVKTLRFSTKCYAVDTWEGDAHAGELEQHVYTNLENYQQPLYGDFSRLVKATFDEALNNFGESSIDLLHIDGFHTYEAVKHDFETWLPKMSTTGIIIFHDTNVRERDFGVWKFWAEIREKYPSFEFLHSHGLGVLAVGEKIPEALKPLFSADESETANIREFFSTLGSRIEITQKSAKQAEYIQALQTYERVVKKSIIMRAYAKFFG
jgi:O-antigen biosynthesis protein